MEAGQLDSAAGPSRPMLETKTEGTAMAQDVRFHHTNKVTQCPKV